MAFGDTIFPYKESNIIEFEDAQGKWQRAIAVINPLEGFNSSPAVQKIPVDLYFSQSNGSPTTLTVAATKDTRVITVDDPANFSIGNRAVMVSPFGAYTGEVLGVAGNNITVAPLIPEDFPIGTAVESRSVDLNVDGSVTPQIFEAFLPPGLIANQLNITRLIAEMLTTTAPELDEFGDIAGGLTFGLLLRGVPNPSSGIPTSNNWNVKTNGELANLAYDLAVFSGTFFGGQDGFVWRYSWGGESKHDVIVPLNEGDKLELIIQDDLTSLQKFRMIFAGNFEVPTP